MLVFTTVQNIFLQLLDNWKQSKVIFWLQTNERHTWHEAKRPCIFFSEDTYQNHFLVVRRVSLQIQLALHAWTFRLRPQHTPGNRTRKHGSCSDRPDARNVPSKRTRCQPTTDKLWLTATWKSSWPWAGAVCTKPVPLLAVTWLAGNSGSSSSGTSGCSYVLPSSEFPWKHEEKPTGKWQ